MFFYSRGLNFIANNHFTSFISNGINFLDNKFFLSFYKNFFIKIDNPSLRRYKMKIKILVKNSFNLSFLKLLKLINKEIEIWSTSFNLFFYRFLNSKLDIYLYKLFWRFFKRLHPRRSSTWIFSKYWKSFSRRLEIIFF